jgi:hypothetical protein
MCAEARVVWLTYAWEDNHDGDVDFVAQELMDSGLSVSLDRWNLRAGLRLWEQIGEHISNPELSDAWLLYATQNSLGSEACKEEFAYALDRALNARGESFPVIALFPCTVDRALIPGWVRARLFVSLTDPEWKERVKAAAEGRSPAIGREAMEPYTLTLHQTSDARYAIELRPRAGTWSPFFAAVPIGEKEALEPSILRGPRGVVPTAGVLLMYGEAVSSDGLWWIMFSNGEASPTQSYFLFCKGVPSRLAFGQRGDQGPQHTVHATVLAEAIREE